MQQFLFSDWRTFWSEGHENLPGRNNVAWKGLPPLEVTANPSEIIRAERALAERIRRARRGAGRGDIFTEDIRRAFRQLLRPVTNEGTCESIRDDNPNEFPYPVNAEYPKDKPVSTMPPSIHGVLPRLPQHVW